MSFVLLSRFSNKTTALKNQSSDARHCPPFLYLERGLMERRVKAVMVSGIQFSWAWALLESAHVGGTVWLGGHSLLALTCQLWHSVIVWSLTLSWNSSLCLTFFICKMGPIIVPISVRLLEDKWEVECALVYTVSSKQVVPSKGLLAKTKHPISILCFALPPITFFL